MGRKEKAQASLEYFILFALISVLVLTVLWRTFLGKVRNATWGTFFKAAAERIMK